MRTFSLCFFGGTWLSLSFTSIDLLNAAGFSAAVLALCIIPILFSRRPSRRFLTAVFALCLGFAYAALYIQQHNQQQLPEALAGQNLLLSGVIRGLPEANDQGYQFLFQLESAILPAAEVDDADDDVIVPALSGLLRLSWYRHFPSQLNSGDRWQLLVRAKPPNGLMNPGSMDYEKWLFAQRIIATGYVRQSAQNQRLGPSRSGYIDRLRQQVQRAIQYHLEDWPEQGLVAALAVAARSDMNVAQWEVLRRTGTSHLMAISGLHIALVAGLGCLPVLVIWWLWPRLYLWLPVRMAAGLSGALAALAYALMAGLTLPTQRALVMVLVLLAGLLWRRNIPFTVVLCWALQAVLLLDPLAALSPGFWLSFAAVLMIFLLTRRDVRRRSKWSVIGIQFGLSLGMIPLTASWFGTVSLVSPLANLLAVPLVGLLVVPLVLAGMLLLPMSEYLVAVCWQLAGYALRGLWWLLEWLAALDWAAFALPQMPWGWMLLAVAGVLLLWLPRGVPGRWLGVLLIMPVFVWQPPRPQPGAFQLDVLDVGQGLASVIQTANHTLVFDAGPKPSDTFDAGQRVVLPWLRAQKIQQLDALLISHADNDHRGGTEAVLKGLPVARLLTNVAGLTPHATQRTEPCQAGMRWQWDGVDFSILHPSAAFTNSKRNNTACVLRVSNASHSVLLSADIERPAEYWLSRRLKGRLQSEVLIVPHHGSSSSSSPAFLKRVEPQLAIVSAGYRSRFRHPHPQVVQRYKDWGIPLLNTAESGAVRVVFPADEQGIAVEEYRVAHRRFWNRR